MRKCAKTAKNRAKAEIYNIIAKDMRISTDRMEGILAKHGVKRDPKALQRAYRLSVGQKIMAEVRDNEGRREILAARTEKGMEYIVIDACHDQVLLARLQHRLREFIAGLERSSGKVRDRQSVLGGFCRRMFRMGGEQ